MTRRETPTRHGRAADALIASYVRELLAEDELEAVPMPPASPAAAPHPAAVEAAATSAIAADATR